MKTSQNILGIARMGRNFDDFHVFQPKTFDCLVGHTYLILCQKYKKSSGITLILSLILTETFVFMVKLIRFHLIGVQYPLYTYVIYPAIGIWVTTFSRISSNFQGRRNVWGRWDWSPLFFCRLVDYIPIGPPHKIVPPRFLTFRCP